MFCLWILYIYIYNVGKILMKVKIFLIRLYRLKSLTILFED